MALKLQENYRGIELPEAYHKIMNMHLDMARYKDLEARDDNLILDTYSISIPITSAIYTELKKLERFQGFQNC